jgi:hypothetical protein
MTCKPWPRIASAMARKSRASAGLIERPIPIGLARGLRSTSSASALAR